MGDNRKSKSDSASTKQKSIATPKVAVAPQVKTAVASGAKASTSKPGLVTSSQATQSDSTPRKVTNFLWIGIVLTLIDYVTYEVLLLTFLPNDLTAAAMISNFVATCAAYFLHSHITWRARDPGKYGIIKFFLWNLLVLALMVRPLLVWMMGLLTFLYDFAFGISQWLGLPFSYDFITSTGVFGLMTLVTMMINYFVYDALIFGQKRRGRKRK